MDNIFEELDIPVPDEDDIPELLKQHSDEVNKWFDKEVKE